MFSDVQETHSTHSIPCIFSWNGMRGMLPLTVQIPHSTRPLRSKGVECGMERVPWNRPESSQSKPAGIKKTWRKMPKPIADFAI